ncbi:MAG: hypothetical protein JSV62_12660 [Promethearchaeota archaeon]|nr:MAG: hypothetical protein JSV62_12660 [Candidatus Lokiarchaeota archaeon]
MPKKYIVVIKTIGRKWFIILIAIILIVAIYNPIAAIWMSGITLVLFLLSYIPNLFFKRKLNKFMKKYYKIEDELIARKFNKSLQKIQDIMFELSQKQEKKDWLIIFLNKQYVYYHGKSILKFEEVYNKGYTEKEILDNLKDFKVTTRAEIKVIKDSLVKLNRLKEREISVKEHKDKQRFA